MVVNGLLSYILNSPHMRRVKLSQLASQIQEDTGKRPKLLLSFSTAERWIWFSPVPVLQQMGDYPSYTSVCGPDFHLAADRARCLVRALKSLQVDPVIFLEAACSREEALSEGYQVQQMLEGTTARAFESVVGPNGHSLRQVLLSLKEEGAELQLCEGGTVTVTRAMARYSRTHEETCGVVGTQADFAVISGCVFFPRREFDSEKAVGLEQGVSIEENPDEIVAMAISSTGLAESLKIREDQLPDLAMLCGTEYTKLLLSRLSVLTALGVEGSDVEDIAAWLRGQEGTLLENEVIKNLCRFHPEFQKALERSYRHFAVEDPPSSDPPSPVSPVCELVERELGQGCSLALSAARRGSVVLPVVLESATLGEPSIVELLRPLRFTLYCLLGVTSVWEKGRTSVKVCEWQEVAVCAGKEESTAAVEHLKLLRGLGRSEKLGALYTLSTILSEGSVASVFDAVDSVTNSSSSELPELGWAVVHKLGVLCVSLRLLALLNNHSSLSISEEELGAVLVASLTCATEARILPHLVHVLPSMKAVSIAEWFCTVIDSVYQLSGMIGLTEGSPEPRNLFYPMAFIPYHLALGTHSELTARQKTDVESVKQALDLALSLPLLAEFRSCVFDTEGEQTLSHLIVRCSAALGEVLEHTEQLLPRTMTAPLEELLTSDEEEDDGEEDDEEYLSGESESGSNCNWMEGSESEDDGRLQEEKKLPITKHREKILELVSEHQVVCVEGETGCGKSSQVPQFILEHSRDSRVLVSQPNSLAAKKLAERVSKELELPSLKVTHCDDIHTEDRNARIVYGTNQFLLEVS